MQRGTWWWVAGVGGAATVALVLVALLTDQEMTGLVSGVAGTVAGVVGAVAAVLALRAPAASSDRTVEARAGGIAAGGDINGTGSSASSGSREVSASGRGSVAAGGDINGIDLNGRSS
ncbi:hypothetical protein [Streptomyces sp. NRRL WC-3742]|uniref:hypothetical protein n=1 Tax=Streptomyces sp. NRRL WC-3742 TaxID=1463934 RepID=UPI0004C64E68|nr:hypothetical protein [Streptomyces sp. NRRL WC-3742]